MNLDHDSTWMVSTSELFFFPDFNARNPTSFRWIRLHTLHTKLPETTKNYAQQIHFALPGYTWFTLVSYGPQSNWVAAVAQLVASLQAVWKIDHLSLMVSAFWGVESSVPSKKIPKKGVNWAGLFQTILGKWSPLWGRRMFFFLMDHPTFFSTQSQWATWATPLMSCLLMDFPGDLERLCFKNLFRRWLQV